MVDPNHSLWLSASHLPALRLPMILTKTSTKTDKSSFSQKRLISLSPHLIFRTTPFYFVTYSPFCNLIGLQYALQREQLALDQTLSARARGCGYARLLRSQADLWEGEKRFPPRLASSLPFVYFPNQVCKSCSSVPGARLGLPLTCFNCAGVGKSKLGEEVRFAHSYSRGPRN